MHNKGWIVESVPAFDGDWLNMSMVDGDWSNLSVIFNA